MLLYLLRKLGKASPTRNHNARNKLEPDCDTKKVGRFTSDLKWDLKITTGSGQIDKPSTTHCPYCDGAGHVSQFRLGAGPEMTDSEDSDTNIQAPSQEQHDYELDHETVLRDAYRLLCLVMADRAIADINDKENLSSLHVRFANYELLHTVIQLAVMNRIQLDNMCPLRSDPSELSYDSIERECGKLIEDIDANSEEKCLTFREACNKIIHAKKIEVTPDENGDRVFPGRGSTLILRGTKKEKKDEKAWQVNLDILEFLCGTFENFK